MTVNEVLMSAGSWSIQLSPVIPRSILDRLDYFGHIAIVPGRVDPRAYGDDLLTAARYVGVLRERDLGDSAKISGAGMVVWLGDEDDKGDIFENATTFASASFANTIRGLLPASGAITEGTLYSVAGAYSGTHQWESSRKAIQYVCDTFGAEYRVNNDGTLDAGLDSDLFNTDNPTCVVVRRNAGRDMRLTGIPGSFETQRDVEDFTTRVVLLAEGEGAAIATGDADINPALNPYKDIHGNTVVRTRLVSESDTSSGNADVRAQLQLNRFTSTRDALQLSATDYEIRGSFEVGDTVWVYDVDSGLVDTANEITFQGQRINPIALRAVETTWPVTEGMTVAYRAGDGTWYDLTDYVVYEGQAATQIVVGELSRSLTSSGFEPVGSRPNADTSVPGVPTFVEPFTGSVFLDARGFSRAQLMVKWSAPLNADGSTILDGDHYEIRYAVDTDQVYPARWEQIEAAGQRWEDLQLWGQPLASPDTGWNLAYSPWGDTSIVIQDLSPGVGYDFQIRAVDKAGNIGEWSATTTALATPDNIAPSTPAAPSVAASRIAIQVTHTLGKASGGTYNLEADLDHFDVHVGYSETYAPDDSTRVGKLKASSGMIAGQIPAVGTFQVEQTDAVYVKVIAVDIAGNASNASDAATVTAELIDDAHISDLTVSKVTAGSILADWIISASIKTADSGARVQMSGSGIQAYNDAGTETVNISSADGSVSIIGQMASGAAGDRVVINPSDATSPTIRFYPNSGTKYARIHSRTKVDEPDEVELYIQAGVNHENTARAILGVRSGTIEASIFDETSTNLIGGLLQVTEDYVLLQYGSHGVLINDSGYNPF